MQISYFLTIFKTVVFLVHSFYTLLLSWTMQAQRTSYIRINLLYIFLLLVRVLTPDKEYMLRYTASRRVIHVVKPARYTKRHEADSKTYLGYADMMKSRFITLVNKQIRVTSLPQLPMSAMSGSSRPVVFIARGVPPSGLARLREVCEVIEWVGSGFIPLDTFVERVRQCKPNAVLVHPPDRVDRQLLDSAGPQLKVVGTMSVGLDHVDLEECRRRGIAVGYTPNVLTSAVAEHALGLALAAARKYKPGMKAIHSSVWGTRWDSALWMAGKEIGGSVIGIVGLGRIGLAVAKRLTSFDPSRIIYCGSGPKDAAGQVGGEFVSFDKLLKEADFVIAACSINEGNKGLFNKDVFAKMKTTAIFVNITRGVLVNQEDLYEALTKGIIGGAALDVTSPEPLPADHPLLSLDNCLVVPHLGSATETTRNRMCNVTVSNILAGLNGETLPSSAL